MTQHLVLLRILFIGLAIALSSVTVISVFLAVSALIADPFLQLLFPLAASLLDVFKYLAWPLATFLWLGRRRALAGAFLVCALVLGLVSGWATYDRLLTAVLGDHSASLATLQRIADIEAAREIDQTRLRQLIADERAVQEQLGALRAQLVASKSVAVEQVSMRRLDSERDKVQARLEASSHELTRLRSIPARNAGLAVDRATYFCIGFALALELVPALLLTATRSVFAREVALPVLSVLPETTPPRQPETTETEDPQAVLDRDQDLLRALLDRTQTAGAGGPVVLREFVREQRVSNTRAARIFQAAESLGALKKAGSGYVATGQLA